MAARGGDEAADSQVVLDAEFRKQSPIFRNMGNSVLNDAVRGSADDRAPVERDGAGEGATRPDMTRISVVLPAPFGPITPTVSPAVTSSDTPNRARNES
jgi:hypothetical protein